MLAALQSPKIDRMKDLTYFLGGTELATAEILF